MTYIAPSSLAKPPQQGNAPSAYAWIVVGMLWFVGMLNYFDRLVITTLHDPIRADISMTDAQFGLLTSAFLWVYAVVSPFGGFFADRFARWGVITASLLFWSAAMYCTGYAHTFHQLLLARALMGLSEACYLPAALAIICDYHPGPTRSFATGLHMSGLSAGAALGGIGGYLAEHFSWRTAFRGLGIAGVAYGLVILFTLRDARVSPNHTPERGGKAAAPFDPAEAVASLFAMRGFLILIAINILVGSVNWAMYGWLPTYLKSRFQLGIGAAGLSATGYIQVAAFAGVFAGGWVADHWVRTNPLARRLTPACMYLLAGPCLFAAASTGVLAPAIAGLIVFGLARGAFDANHMPILREVADERFSATGFGFLNLVSCAAGGLMVYVGGILSDAHIDLARVFQFCGLLLPAVGLLLIALSRVAVAPGGPSK